MILDFFKIIEKKQNNKVGLDTLTRNFDGN